MNIRRGLTRIWTIFTLIFVLITAVLIYEPVFAWMQLSGTTGFVIRHNDNDISYSIRINSRFKGLAVEQQNPVIYRAVFLLNLNTDDQNSCAELGKVMDDKLRDAISANNIQFADLIKKPMNELKQKTYSSIGFELEPREIYSLKKVFPEYSDLNVLDFATKFEKKITNCRPTNIGSVQLADNLEQIAKTAFTANREEIERQIKTPVMIFGSIVAVFWCALMAGFWIASGFKSKRI